MNNLSITSRILIAFASGALVAVYFLPAWRIDLFAPQYPEGLVMKIWINNITGDVDIINGLNHYIGMKHITVEMFPEFKFLPYVVAFFIVLGMIVAISGNKKLLSFYLVLTVIGGAAAIYDFYQWGYDYGHNLDPKAPIQVPGLSYQPPILGHKRLLNFDAYSWPDVAGWIVIGASALAFAVWMMESAKHYRARKILKTNSAPKTGFALWFLLVLASCSTGPEPLLPGKDVCHFCKMGVADPKFGGEVVTKKGRIFKFDDVHCLVGFIKEGHVAEKDIAHTLVVNYEKSDHLINAHKAYFVISPALKSPMSSNAAGFSSEMAAAEMMKAKPGQLSSWKNLIEQMK